MGMAKTAEDNEMITCDRMYMTGRDAISAYIGEGMSYSCYRRRIPVTTEPPRIDRPKAGDVDNETVKYLK